MNREELAWAAGLFDGEGSVGGRWRQRKSGGRSDFIRDCNIRVAQSGDFAPDILKRFRAAVLNRGKVYKVNGHARVKLQPYIWQASRFEDVQAVIALLWNWLSEAKRQQAKESLSHYLHRTPYQ